MRRNRLLPLYFLLLAVGLGAMYYLRILARGGDELKLPLSRDYAEIACEGRLRLQAVYNTLEADAEVGTALAYDLARLLSERSGLEVEVILENDRDKALQMLLEGRVDVITRAITRTSEVDTTLFSLVRQQLSGPLHLVQRRDSATLIRRQIDLANKTIVLPKGSRWRIFVDHLSEEIGEKISVDFDPLYDTEQLIMKVAAGSIDYTLCSDRESKHYSPLFEGLDFDLPVSYSLRSAWLIRRNAPVLLDSLSLWLGEVGRE